MSTESEHVLNHITQKYLTPQAVNISAAKLKLNKSVSLKTCFSLLHINVRSLNANFDYFENFIDILSLPFSIIGISELWLNETENFNQFNIQGYNFEPKPKKNNLGGGVGCYIRDNLDYAIRKDINIEQCDNLWIELKPNNNNNKKQLVCIAYHSPTKQETNLFVSSLGEVLNSINQNKYDVTFLGDLNLNLFTLDPSSEYLQNMLVNNMKSLIVYPTRTTDTTDTLIDHIFTNNSTKHVTAGIIYGDIADHIPTFCIFNDIHTYFKEPTSRTLYDTKNYVTEDFQNDLKKVKFTNILRIKDADAAFTELIDNFLPISQRHIPSKTANIKIKKQNNRKEWITYELVKQIKNNTKCMSYLKKIHTTQNSNSNTHHSKTSCAKTLKKRRRDITKTSLPRIYQTQEKSGESSKIS
eukprot:Lithocolla_globosa_v1_NODE_441_length_4050_cov_246.680100.p1 type:complete len:412 gc:universal NODE_441_length_4050_cov_246.680100:2734-1499(-)